MIGLFTRCVAFVLAGEMAFAYFMGHMFKGETPVFHGEAATVPVVAGLHAAVLQRVLVQVIAEIHAAAEAGLGAGAVAERGTDLLIVGDRRGRGGGG